MASLFLIFPVHVVLLCFLFQVSVVVVVVVPAFVGSLFVVVSVVVEVCVVMIALLYEL